MDPDDRRLLNETRRHFFSRAGIGLGQLALAQFLSDGRLFAEPDKPRQTMEPRPTHFPAKVKNVIYLFMAGGPSQLEMFDYKPKLQEYDGKPIPESLVAGKRFAFMDAFQKEPLKVLGSRREFKQYGRSGAWVSNLLPHISTVVDDVAFVSGISTDNFNHGPAKCFINTGSTRFGRPSMGSWVTYGIGAESQDLPGFVVLLSGPRGPRGGAGLWSSGFLPSAYQGVTFRSGGDPILDLSNPEGITPRTQRQTIDAIRDLNAAALTDQACKETDGPTAALIKDLKQRGLFDSTLVIWGGEFGRTPMAEKRTTAGGRIGRNHHIEAYSMLFAGGGVTRGAVIGGTDD